MKKVILVQLILVVSVVSVVGQWQMSGSNIFFNNGNVGIGVGTKTPGFKLEVAGTFFAHNTYLSNASIGHSGIHYEEFGYNIGFTDINDTYVYRATNYAASIRMGYNGSIEFRTAARGNAGENLTLNERMRITLNGNVGVGTTSPEHKLDVVGTVRAHEMLVNTQKTADFVFKEDYRLKPLKEVEQFISENKHLPDIAPADTMLQNGVNMGEFQIQLLQKIEELTLYMIQQEQRIDALTNELDALRKDQ